jgi:hypothetical protein
MNLTTHAVRAVAAEKAALEYIAMAYLGASLFGQRYYLWVSTKSNVWNGNEYWILTGVQMKLAFIIVETIPIAADFFSLVWPQVEPTHPRMRELTAYVPIQNTTMAKYRTPMLSELAPIMNPIMATDFDAVMCQVRSLNFPDSHETRMVDAPAIKYGGHVRTRVMVSLKPRVSTTVGNFDC